ncbi:uncharacterized protein MYCFIDRAFT_172474 [Pseudocercospora fijiensis CIRAD86]|uniref:Uncharacterized protein n=1 Tax=Pseudocercospora fijiensis (strain CIRAD86) TaxID=383855 RepID=M3A6R7_PSEFD|nr:uncharacterized protein MYCFIDRAFT_172474 [Pseudocercospora fijiensis CIRAD86]EME86779.1 hypothetical protein MYCFIDRAFT_172474 [Pseudocercospora fijiensis CIRAD86]
MAQEEGCGVQLVSSARATDGVDTGRDGLEDTLACEHAIAIALPRSPAGTSIQSRNITCSLRTMEHRGGSSQSESALECAQATGVAALSVSAALINSCAVFATLCTTLVITRPACSSDLITNTQYAASDGNEHSTNNALGRTSRAVNACFLCPFLADKPENLVISRLICCVLACQGLCRTLTICQNNNRDMLIVQQYLSKQSRGDFRRTCDRIANAARSSADARFNQTDRRTDTGATEDTEIHRKLGLYRRLTGHWSGREGGRYVKGRRKVGTARKKRTRRDIQ